MIEKRLIGFVISRPQILTDGERTQIHDLAVAALDGERDRALGAAVRECRADMYSRHGEAFDVAAAAEDIGHGTTYMPYVEGAKILSAIAEHVGNEKP